MNLGIEWNKFFLNSD